jgi:2-oxoisovalerate dehydrogenase E2 component (dihydrolipoyl transacylase)
MGRYVFKLPDVGEGTAEAEIVAWHVKPGDAVSEDQPLVDIMTDKATVEITSPVAGVVAELRGSPGDMAPVGGELVILMTDGEAPAEAPAPVAQAPAAQAPVSKAEAAPVVETVVKPEPAARPAPRPDPVRMHSRTPPPADFAAELAKLRQRSDRPLASPALRQKARDLGIDLRRVTGSGPAGRIDYADLDAFQLEALNPEPAAQLAVGKAPREGVAEIKIIGMRRKIAEKMQAAKRHIPHITYVEEIDATELEALRQYLNANKRADQPKLTLLPFFVLAMIKAIPHHPQINARYDDEAGILSQYEGVHVGIATQGPSGLLVPVVRHAETLGIFECAAEIARVTQAARDGTATREELSGSTITITSLGTLGGIVHTPVINWPEVAIVGPNKIVERPVVKDGQVVIRKMMNLSSSFDHRIVDGWDAASFVQKIKGSLEFPAALFVN